MNNQERKTDNIGQNLAEGELRLVKSVIQDFLQGLKIFQLYESGHPLLLRFLDRLKQDFDNYFEKNEALVIHLDELHFYLDGVPVYENKDLRESLSFMFFKDGIREIRFFRGLEQTEMFDFLTIVRKSNIVNRMDDDLVTLLWEKDFLHIDFTVIDQFFEEDGILVPLTEEDLIKGLEYRGFGETEIKQHSTDFNLGDKGEPGTGLGSGLGSGGGIGDQTGGGTGLGSMNGTGLETGKRIGATTKSGTGRGTAGGPGTRKGTGTEAGAVIGLGKDGHLELESDTATGGLPNLVIEELRQALVLSSDKNLAQVCSLTPDEIEEIYKRAQKEELSETLYALINNFTEILLHLGEDKKTYENIVLYFDRIVKSLLEQREIRKVVTILENFHNMISTIPLKETQRSTVERILQIASDPQSIELLGKTMQNSDADIEPILLYLELVTQNAIDPLCSLLRSLDSETWRKIVRERLTELCNGTIHPLVKFLSDSKVSFTSDLLYILEKVEDPSTLKYLTHLSIHENSEIREEALKLGTVFKEGGKDFLQNFLKDPVPEIRGKAALMFAKTAGEEAVNPLVEIILSKDFYLRGYEEKVYFFRALSETKSQKVIPILREIIRKKKWFNKERWEKMRICAIYALRTMGVGEKE